MTNDNKAWEEDSIKVDDADGNLAFEVIDLVKPEKLVPTYVKGAEYSDWRKELDAWRYRISWQSPFKKGEC